MPINHYTNQIHLSANQSYSYTRDNASQSINQQTRTASSSTCQSLVVINNHQPVQAQLITGKDPKIHIEQYYQSINQFGGHPAKLVPAQKKCKGQNPRYT